MMKPPASKITVVVTALLSLMQQATAESVLTERVLEITYESVKLSALAYETASDYADSTARTGFSHPDFEDISFYTEEPDQAMIARKEGRCYIAFRGTTKSFTDWGQNLNKLATAVYKDNDESSGQSCMARAGFAEFVLSEVLSGARTEYLDCINNYCTDPDDCLVITGHSQGGAQSAVLSILTYGQNPTVITFGAPTALEPDCDLILSDRSYRFVNFVEKDGETGAISFDPVPFSPPPRSDIELAHYGHFILLGPDTTAAKYVGFDTDYDLEPVVDALEDIKAHTLAGDTDYGYEARIAGLYLDGTGFPVSTDGYASGVFCVPEYEEFCETSSCQNNACAASGAASVTCQADTDCDSGWKCLDGVCVDQCVVDTDCSSEEECVQGECVSSDPSDASAATIILDRTQVAFAGAFLLVLTVCGI